MGDTITANTLKQLALSYAASLNGDLSDAMRIYAWFEEDYEFVEEEPKKSKVTPLKPVN
jgi:hypothetical protein